MDNMFGQTRVRKKHQLNEVINGLFLYSLQIIFSEFLCQAIGPWP